jgi:ankyrin repeat protein
MKKALDNL